MDDSFDRNFNFDGLPPQETLFQRVLPYASAFFLTIATVLGTGILSLPVKLAHSGFTPFVIIYTLCFFGQAFITLFLTEILQRHKACSILHNPSLTIQAYTDDLEQMKDGTQGEQLETFSSEVDEEMSELRLDTSQEQAPQPPKSDHGDLHSIAKIFLRPILARIYDVGLIMHFISVMVSYSLAGSEAYAHLFGIESKFIYLIFPFVLVCTSIITFGKKILQPVLSFATFAKASLLFLLVVVTAIVANLTEQTPVDNWRYIGKSFLISTVALGGAYNILPVVFSKVKWTRKALMGMALCSVLGLTVVWIMNVLWCYYVLHIVPQTSEDPDDPNHVITLFGAEQYGKIATIPLINQIELISPTYAWVGKIIDVFIVISITISFMTMGTAFQHVLDGLAHSWKKFTQRSVQPNIFVRFWTFLSSLSETKKQYIIYGINFSFILAVALINPHSLILILEKFTSFAVNITGGVLLVWMLVCARVIAPMEIPFSLNGFIYMFRWPVMAFFVGAMVYDLLTIALAWTDIDVL